MTSSPKTATGIWMLFVGLVAIPAQAQIMEWRPVGSTGPYECGGVDPDPT